MKLNEILGTEFPFIQGGMANIATGEFAAAVSNAGGFGLIGAGGMNTESLRENIRKCRELTDKPFGVNLMLMNHDTPSMAKLVVEEGIKVLTTGAGNPGEYMPMWKEAGIKVFPVIPTVALARRMEQAGADGVIAEGCESGGHVGELTTMALVPQVVAAVNIPVIAAGGIANGGQLLSVYALGACGAQLGTCLLVSEECPIHDNYKQAVIKAGDNDTIVTGRMAGVPVRIIKNKMARNYVKREKEGANKDELESYTLGSLRKAVVEGDVHNGSLMAGQISGQLKEIRTLREIFVSLNDEANSVLEMLNGRKICS